MRQLFLPSTIAACLLVAGAAHAAEIRAVLDDVDPQAGTITFDGQTMRLEPGTNVSALQEGTRYVVFYDDSVAGMPIFQSFDYDQTDGDRQQQSYSPRDQEAMGEEHHRESHSKK